MPYIKEADCRCRPPHGRWPLSGRKAEKHAGSVWKCPKCKQLWIAGVRRENRYTVLSTWTRTSWYALRKAAAEERKTP